MDHIDNLLRDHFGLPKVVIVFVHLVNFAEWVEGIILRYLLGLGPFHSHFPYPFPIPISIPISSPIPSPSPSRLTIERIFFSG